MLDILKSSFVNNVSNLEQKEKTEEPSETAIIEYREIDEPCVALTIIGENRLSNTGVFVKRGIKYSIKAFFLL